ncbi:hypothetical protein BEWA_005540 [Theileria equi strain WA]|uniref:tRNA/rRNA methyltransferase SpoU type domain-containing protein n=1 Tax=Theileria equi strain WA TaxID=1537102 RepID=L0B1L9_THEEQ|nr:hypothetical protein BEWA_005540 [Theileria equi strain WA]AFZ81146.1 hypothetical protein BEWA_005540 [Theileria equi strain WA]|eukprot:XP_004830812.1 hypothetical protein BEWA_005540 [Theileria equi strain WA]
MNSGDVVARILDEIKQRSSLHVERSGRVAHKKARQVAGVSRDDKIISKIARSRFIFKTPSYSQNTDYFTRLINSSPKPRVLRSLHHPIVTHLLKLSNSSSYRSYRGLILLSSIKLIREYCRLNGSCARIYTTTHTNQLLMENDVKFDKVLIASKRVLERAGNLHSYDRGLLAEVPYPQPSRDLGSSKLVLCVCPSNKNDMRLTNSSLGTIMRSAQGLQWQSIWILKNGDIDLLDPLSIRASQNCLSTMPYSRGTIEETLEFANKNNLFMCKCTNNGIDVQSVEMQEKLKSYDGVMLLVGNIPYELRSASTEIRVNIQSKRFLNVKSEEANVHEIGAGTNDTVTNEPEKPSLETKPNNPHYTLDTQVSTSIAMYIIKKTFFNDIPRSPFIMAGTKNSDHTDK